MTDKQLGTAHFSATDPLVATHGYEVAERASILQAEGMSKEESEKVAIKMNSADNDKTYTERAG